MDSVKKKNKILVLTHMFPNIVHPYLGNQIYERSLELSKYYDIKIVAPIPYAPNIFKKINPYYLYTKIPYKEKFAGIDIYHPRYFTFPGTFLYFLDALTYFLSVSRLINIINSGWQIDLIDAHRAFPDGFVATRIASRLNNKTKVVTTEHGFCKWPFGCNKIALNGLVKSDRVIGVSLIVKDKLKKILPKTHTDVVQIGVKIPKNNYQLPKAIRNLIKNKFVIFSAGNLYKDKGHIYLIKAINIIKNTYKNIVCIIAGDGTEYRNLCEYVKLNDLGRYVHFVKALPNKKIHTYYACSDVFVLPSWNESLGIVYLEAMMHGKPIIGCKGQGPSKLITTGKEGFLVKPRNEKQIALLLEKMINDQKLTKEMGKLAHKKAIIDYSFKKSIVKTIHIYDLLLSS